MQITITLPDGSTRDYEQGVTAGEVAASIGRGLAKAALAAKVTEDGGEAEWYDLSRPIEHDAALAVVTPDSSEGREVLRHSTAHVMAQAVTDLFPGAKYAIGPAIEDGFYYDFELPDGAHFSDDDLGRIEARMREIVQEDEPFLREELDREHAIATFSDQPYKVEIIERVEPEDVSEIGEGNVISVYRNPRASMDRPPSGSARSSSPRSPVPTGGATRSARCCNASTAPRGSRRPRSRSTCIAWKKPRSATTGSSGPSSTSSRSPTRSARAWRCSTPRAGPSAG
jgi:hypothetical protein